jgi:uncharacterized membrane protein
MSTKNMVITVIVILAVSIFLSAVAYPLMPERVASHWNAQGQVNGYSGRLSGVALMPLITIALVLLLHFLPMIDPLKANVLKFRPQYNIIIVVLATYMTYLHILTLANNLGFRVNMTVGLVPAFAALDFAIGFLLTKAKRNFFIGIRTPWTLSSDLVWDKTHQRGGLLYKWAGVLTLLGLILPDQAFLLLIGPLLLVSVYTVVYSYFVYQQVTKNNG